MTAVAHALARATTCSLAWMTLLLSLPACEEKKPDRLALDPAGPFRFERKGETETVNVAAFTGARPYVRAVPVEYASSDATVATVDAKGVITCTGSGAATVTARAWGISTTADISATVVGSVEVKDDVPRPFKLKNPGVQLHVVVKDDKGHVIDKPKVSFRATDYCVEVDDAGFMKPLADGDCDVVVSAADQSARLKLQVRE